MDQSKQLFEDSLSEEQKMERDNNPETIKLLNKLHTDVKGIVLTVLQNFPPEGFIARTIDSLTISAGFVDRCLYHYGSHESRVLFENTSVSELDAEINVGKPTEMVGSQVRRLKEIRMLMLSIAKRMDNLGINIITNFEAQRMLGQARNHFETATIFVEESAKSVSYILTSNPAPSIIQVGGDVKL